MAPPRDLRDDVDVILRTNLTLGDGDVVSLTDIIVNSTLGVDQSSRMGPGEGIYTETDFECVRSVLNAAEARLLSDADGVVLVGQMDSSSKVVALQSSSRSCEPLGTAGPWSPLSSALYLTLYEMKLIKDPGIVLHLILIVQRAVPLHHWNPIRGS